MPNLSNFSSLYLSHLFLITAFNSRVRTWGPNINKLIHQAHFCALLNQHTQTQRWRFETTAMLNRAISRSSNRRPQPPPSNSTLLPIISIPIPLPKGPLSIPFFWVLKCVFSNLRDYWRFLFSKILNKMNRDECYFIMGMCFAICRLQKELMALMVCPFHIKLISSFSSLCVSHTHTDTSKSFVPDKEKGIKFFLYKWYSLIILEVEKDCKQFKLYHLIV